VRDEAVAEDGNRCTGATGLGFDGGVVAAMGGCGLVRETGGGHRMMQPREKKRGEEKRNEERKKGKEKKRKRKKMKVRKHIGYKKEVYYIFLRNCES
jgi:hypothetical protein